MSNEIVITVATNCGGGKTCISHHIGQVLRDLGFDVDIVDDNGIGLIEQTEPQAFARKDAAVKSLVERGRKITVKTMQIRRARSLDDQYKLCGEA